MPEENPPQNLPTEGKDLSKNVEKGEGTPTPAKEPESRPEPTPMRPAPKEAKEAEDIFADVKESQTAPSPPSKQGETTPAEAPKEETVVETPHQGFKKVLITIIVIVVFAGVLAGGGYWAYNSFLKPRPLDPSLNMNINITPQQPEQPAPQPQDMDSDNDGLNDAREQELGTDPLSPDSDGDKLFDREEVDVYKTDPLNKDTDGDGFEDGSEVQDGYDPKGPGKLIEIPTE
ncbi:hypothetical protein ACFL29_02230 [Patescibacteria group bacterium]